MDPRTTININKIVGGVYKVTILLRGLPLFLVWKPRGLVINPA
jgi:hypothetical protein